LKPTLAVDIGNSQVKYAFSFDGTDLIELSTIEDLSKLLIENKVTELDFICSNVKTAKEFDYLKESLNAILVDQKIELSTINWTQYFKHGQLFDLRTSFQQTIGQDRLVALYHFSQENHNKQLIIDAGSYLTIDLLDGKHHIGGYIFPGIEALLGAYDKSEALKALRSTIKSEQVFSKAQLSQWPTSSSQAMAQSVHLAFQGILGQTINQARPSKIAVTGGWALNMIPLIEKLIEDKEAQVVFGPNAIALGLLTLANKTRDIEQKLS
jgi:pantothenate kinase type III